MAVSRRRTKQREMTMYKGRIVDVDVHHQYKTPTDIVEYLPAKWRKAIEIPGRGSNMPLHPEAVRRFGLDAYLGDAEPPVGPEGSDYDLMRQQLLDPLDIDIAVLTYDVGLESGVANPYLSAALCHAANAWTADHWLTRDDRLRGSILIGTELPDQAAREIEHWAPDHRFAGVLIVANSLHRPFGHPVYHPIYEAAQECGIPVLIHVGGENVAKTGQTASGYTASMLEHYALLGQPAMHYVTSFVTHGVFDKFPRLNLMLVEERFTWLPWVVWRLDASYALIKKECPWVKELPSTTLRRQMKLSTQPIDYIAPARMQELLGTFEAFEDMLCFSTDYPHNDLDEPAHISTRLPKAWWPKVFHENADSVFGARSVAAGPAKASVS
jgi:predicted TIM-barrel fold metal-dependent hydrolase